MPGPGFDAVAARGEFVGLLAKSEKDSLGGPGETQSEFVRLVLEPNCRCCVARLLAELIDLRCVVRLLAEPPVRRVGGDLDCILAEPIRLLDVCSFFVSL